jgi:hypothetical protein
MLERWFKPGIPQFKPGALPSYYNYSFDEDNASIN